MTAQHDRQALADTNRFLINQHALQHLQSLKEKLDPNMLHAVQLLYALLDRDKVKLDPEQDELESLINTLDLGEPRGLAENLNLAEVRPGDWSPVELAEEMIELVRGAAMERSLL